MERQVISFNGKKLNWDDNIDLIPLGDSRYRLDIVYPDGDTNVIESRKAFSTAIIGLSIGSNVAVGYCDDTERDAKIIAFYNSNNAHSIIRIYNNSSDYDELSLGKSAWNFQEFYQVEMSIIGAGDDAFLIMNDNYNPTRCVNIKRLLDGEYPALSSCDINLLRPNPLQTFVCEAGVDTAIKYNYISGKRFQFAYKHIFKDGLESSISHWSNSLYTYLNDRGISDEYITSELDNSYRYGGGITPIFSPRVNKISLKLNGNYSVDKIKIYVKVTDIGSGVSGTWGLYDTIDVSTFSWSVDNIYSFYNDKQVQYVDQLDFNYIQYEVPFKSGTMNVINGDRILLGRNDTKYDNVDVDINLAVSTSNYAYSVININQSAPSSSYANVVLNIAGYLTGGDKILYVVVISKTTGGIVVSKETYTYQYDSLYISGAYQNNTNVVNYFVSEINAKTKYNITASVISGGNPNRISLYNPDYGTDIISATCVSAPAITKDLVFKENSAVNLGICYYDANGVSTKVQPLSVLNIPANGGVSTDTAGFFTNSIYYQINNMPPTEAVYMQFMYAGSNVSEHFTIPMLFTDYLGYTSDLEFSEGNTLINIDQAINRCYSSNELVNINNFTVKKGDRIRIKGYMLTGIILINLSEYIDIEIIGVNNDGKLIIPSLSSFNEYKNITSRKIYVVEFYRKRVISNSSDLVYYEIGDVIPVNTTTPVNGVINGGDAYVFPYYFTDIGVPLVFRIESKSSSFGYDSKLLSPLLDATSGRYNIVDDKQKRTVDQSLTYGGVLKQGDLNYNEINKFTNTPVYLDSKYGNIIGVVQKGNTLHVYQETKISSIYLNAVETTLADGSTEMNYTDTILGTIKYMPYNIGCSHKGSITNNLHSTYFYDVRTSSWYRFSQDGLKDITAAAKMKSYGAYLSNIIAYSISGGNTIKIVSGYDAVKDLYLFTFKNYTYPTRNVTLGYHEPTNSWLSWYSFYPDMYFGFNNNNFYHVEKSTTAAINLYKHHVSDTRVTTGIVQVHFNYSPADVKTFDSIELISDQIWAPTELNDITVDDNSVAYQNPDTNEWSYGKMSSLLKETNFREREGRFFSTFLRNMLNNAGLLGYTIELFKGDVLKGNTLNIKLRNTKTTANTLKGIIIGYRKSL
jgi:hypothetical protein